MGFSKNPLRLDLKRQYLIKEYLDLHGGYGPSAGPRVRRPPLASFERSSLGRVCLVCTWRWRRKFCLASRLPLLRRARSRSRKSRSFVSSFSFFFFPLISLFFYCCARSMLLVTPNNYRLGDHFDDVGGARQRQPSQARQGSGNNCLPI